jgi:transcriptional regulator with XRE-family HTH domain
MSIGERLRAIREQRHHSQADFESRTGICRTYLSRVETGYTVPLVSTLQKFARVLKVPLYQLFYDGTVTLSSSNPKDRTRFVKAAWGNRGKDARLLKRLPSCLCRMDNRDIKLLMVLDRGTAATPKPSRGRLRTRAKR